MTPTLHLHPAVTSRLEDEVAALRRALREAQDARLTAELRATNLGVALAQLLTYRTVAGPGQASTLMERRRLYAEGLLVSYGLLPRTGRGR